MLRGLISAAISFVTVSMCVPALATELTNLWLDVPFVPQQKDGCGAASIAMVMQYWERHQSQPLRPAAEPSQILRALYSNQAHGIYASAMVRLLSAKRLSRLRLRRRNDGPRAPTGAGPPPDRRAPARLRPVVALRCGRRPRRNASARARQRPRAAQAP